MDSIERKSPVSDMESTDTVLVIAEDSDQSAHYAPKGQTGGAKKRTTKNTRRKRGSRRKPRAKTTDTAAKEKKPDDDNEPGELEDEKKDEAAPWAEEKEKNDAEKQDNMDMEEDEDEGEWITVPRPAVDVVNGKNGDMIKRIQQDSGAHVKLIEDQEGIHGIHGVQFCHITGTNDQKQKASALIRDLIQSVDTEIMVAGRQTTCLPITYYLSPLIHEKGVPECSSTLPVTNMPPLSHQHVTLAIGAEFEDIPAILNENTDSKISVTPEQELPENECGHKNISAIPTENCYSETLYFDYNETEEQEELLLNFQDLILLENDDGQEDIPTIPNENTNCKVAEPEPEPEVILLSEHEEIDAVPKPRRREKVQRRRDEDKKLMTVEEMKQKIIENEKLYLDYKMKLIKAQKENKELKDQVGKDSDKVTQLRAALEVKDKALSETEADLERFKAELRYKLKMQAEIDQLKKEIAATQRITRKHKKQTKINQQKLYKKAAQEQVMKRELEQNIQFMKEFGYLFEKNKLLPKSGMETTENMVIEARMQLELYEDSNMEEIAKLYNEDKLEEEVVEDDQEKERREKEKEES